VFDFAVFTFGVVTVPFLGDGILNLRLMDLRFGR
jgi:hypothetical protein